VDSLKKRNIALMGGLFLIFVGILQSVSDYFYDLFGAIFSLIAGVGLLLLSKLISKKGKKERVEPHVIEQRNKFITRWAYFGTFLGALGGGYTLFKMDFSMVEILTIICIAVLAVVLVFKVIAVRWNL